MASNEKSIATNRKASFNYEILERFEAGIVLTGTEVKSCREGKANLSDAYAAMNRGELFLFHCHISPYPNAGPFNHPPLRQRKLLLHRSEIDKLIGKVEEKGLSLIPTKLYFKQGKAKLELALARGKKTLDKRETEKKREGAREIERAMKTRR